MKPLAKRTTLVAWLLVAGMSWCAAADETPKAEGRPQLVVQVAHRAPITAAASSPDGRFLVSGDASGRVFFWDAATGKELRELRMPAAGPQVAAGGIPTSDSGRYVVNELLFSPDGGLVGARFGVAWSGAPQAHLWDTATGRHVQGFQDLKGGGWAFSSDGKRLFVANEVYRRGGTGATPFGDPQPICKREFPDDEIANLALGKKYLAQVSKKGLIKIVELETLKEVNEFSLLRGDNKSAESVTAMCFSPDDQLLVGGRGGTVLYGDPVAGRALWSAGVRDPIEHLQFSPDGTRAIARTVHRYSMFDVPGGKEIARMHRVRPALAGVFSPDGKAVLTGHGDMLARLWSVESGKPLAQFEGALGAVTAVAFVRAGNSVAALDSYGILSVWNLADGKLQRQVMLSGSEAGKDPLQAEVFAGNDVFQGAFGDAPTGLGGERYPAGPLSYSYERGPTGVFGNLGQTLLYISGSGTLDTGAFDVATGKRLKFPPDGYELQRVLGLSPDARFFVGSRMVIYPDGHGEANDIWLTGFANGKYIAKVGESSFFAGPSVVAISPDNVWVAIDDGADKVRIVAGVNGKLYATLNTGAATVFSLAFSPDAKLVAIGGTRGKAQIWDRASGKLLRELAGHADDVTGVAFSPDGKRLLTTSADETARLWNVASGKQVHELAERLPTVAQVEFLPSGDLLIAMRTGDVQALDLKTEKIVAGRRVTAAGEDLRLVAPTPSGNRMIVSTPLRGEHVNQNPRLSFQPLTADGPTRKLVDSAESRTTYRQSAVFKPGSFDIASVSHTGTVRTWDKHGLASHVTLEGNDFLTADAEILFDPTARFIAAARNIFGDAMEMRLWDPTTGKLLHQGQNLEYLNDRLAFVTDDKPGWMLVDLKTKKTLRRFGEDSNPGDVSLDGKLLLNIHAPDELRVLDMASFKELRRIKITPSQQAIKYLPAPKKDEPEEEKKEESGGFLDLLGGLFKGNDQTSDYYQRFSTAAAFSPSGRLILTSQYYVHKLWDTATGKELCEVQWALAPEQPADATRPAFLWVTQLVLSPDEKWLVGTPTGAFNAMPNDQFSSRHYLVVWNAADGTVAKVIQTLAPPSGEPRFSPDGKLILQMGSDDMIYLWERETGKLACQLAMLDDKNWAVVDPEGRFDAPNGGDVAGLHWVIGNEPVDLDQLKERYYEPDLLGKKLGLVKEAVRNVDALDAPKLAPKVQVVPAADQPGKMQIVLDNRGGGIGRVVVTLNGKEINPDARGPKPDPTAREVKLPIEIPADHPLLAPGKNVVKVVAYNAEGYMRSRGLDIDFTAPEVPDEQKPEVWIIASGVTNYRGGDRLRCPYASKDAEDIARALGLGAKRLFGTDRVRAAVLSSNAMESDLRPTRANLLKQLEQAKSSKVNDVLVIYLAGHGVTAAGQEGDFYYLCADALSDDLRDQAVREQVAVSSQELGELLKQIPARKQVVILDTCAAGRLIEDLNNKRDIPSSQTRALDRLKDRTGTFVLAGCAADAVSYEASRYAQGVLTYSLLMGLRGAALREEQFVDVERLFNFAVDMVPSLAADIGGIQRPRVSAPDAQSFDIGQMSPEDRGLVPLQPARPLIVRSAFQDEATFDDVLGLGKFVDDLLRDASAAPNAKFVYVDGRGLPQSLRLAGRYQTTGDKTTLTANLLFDQQLVRRFTISGTPDNPGELATKLYAEFEKTNLPVPRGVMPQKAAAAK